MQHQQFERDLVHLERIVSLLARGNITALAYWRNRVATLAKEQYLIPSGTLRVNRLLDVLEEIGHAKTP